MNVTDPIRRHATLTPAATAYLHGDLTEISYLELERTIDTVANRMRELGLTPGQSAALHSVDYYRFIVATLALARVGVASAPISLPAHLTDVAFVDRGLVANGCPRVVVLDDLWPTDQQTLSATPPASIHRDDAAIFLNSPSSGTTGTHAFARTPAQRQWQDHARQTRGLRRSGEPGAGRGAPEERDAAIRAGRCSIGLSRFQCRGRDAAFVFRPSVKVNLRALPFPRGCGTEDRRANSRRQVAIQRKRSSFNSPRRHR